MKTFTTSCLIALVMLLSVELNAQTTYNPAVRSKNNNCTITSVSITGNYTVVKILVPSSYRSASISNVTVLVPDEEWPISSARASSIDLSDFPGFGSSSAMNQLLAQKVNECREAKQYMSDRGWLIRSLGNDEFDTKYHAARTRTPRGWRINDSFEFTLYFDALPPGIEHFYIRELKQGGWEWVGITINNPRQSSLVTDYNTFSIKSKIDEDNDGITGIYEGTNVEGNRYTLGCIKDGAQYKLIYLQSVETMPNWKAGEVKCILHPTATNGLYRGDWYLANKKIDTNCFISFTGSLMSVLLDGDKEEYVKMYPNVESAASKPTEWSGSGFALKNGYIATNYHVVDGANTITVLGINGSFSTEYKASVVATDKTNDLALIKIDDYRFNGFGSISYAVKTGMADVGEDVYVLGYPLTTVMGEEIKLTTGVISSRTGFQGDVSSYQISAPIQPGNSGGPLFDSKGNLIGIVNAKISAAENVGYAIKASYLKNLVESYTSSSILPSSNTVSSLSRPNQIKSLRNFVFLLKCSSKSSGTTSSSSATSGTTSSSSATYGSRGDGSFSNSTNSSGSGSGGFASDSIRVKETYSAEAVDLGLSVKWSSMNLGATSPTDYGDYFSWGETSTKDNYSWDTYELCNGSSSTLTKYNNNSSYGTVDNKSEFKDYNYEDDAARQALGVKWRIPTDAEWTELRTKCTCTWKTNYNGSGINGILVTATNGNSIFLPAASRRYDASLGMAGAYGFYWASSVYTGYPSDAWRVYFDSDIVERSHYNRCNGYSVRPVCEE